MWKIFDKTWWSWTKVLDILSTVSPQAAAVRWGYILAESIHKAVTTGDLKAAAFCLRAAGLTKQAEYLRIYDAVSNSDGPKQTLSKLAFLIPDPIMRQAISAALSSGSDTHAREFYDEMDAMTKMDAFIERDTVLNRAPLPVLVTFGYARPVARVITGYYHEMASEFSGDPYDLYSIAPLSSIMTWVEPVHGKTYFVRSTSNDVIYEVPEAYMRYPNDVADAWSSLAEAYVWADAVSTKPPREPSQEQLLNWQDALRQQEAYTAAAKAELRTYTPPNISSSLSSYPVWARRNYGPRIKLGVLRMPAGLDVSDPELIRRIAVASTADSRTTGDAWPYPQFWAYIKQGQERQFNKNSNAKN